MKIKNCLAIATMIALLTACNLDYFQDAEFGEFVWDGSLAIPLGEIEYSVSELFIELDNGSAIIEPGEDNVVTIIYEERLAAQGASDFLDILDQTFSGSLPSNATINNAPATQPFSARQTFEFDFSSQGDEAIDSIYFDNGTLNLSLNSTVSYPLTYAVTFRSLAQNGTPVVANGTIAASGNAQETNALNGQVGLLHLDALGNPAANKFLVEVAYTLDIPAGGNLAPNDGVSFDLGIRNTGYSDLYGNVGRQGLNINLEEIDLAFFEIFEDGDLRFANPSLQFIIQNSFGFPLGVDYSGISASTSDGTIINLTGSITEQLVTVDAPTINEQGGTRETIHSIDATNSNIAELFSAQPSAFSLGLSAISNPINGPVQYNFLNELNTLEAAALIEIPLDMAIDELFANQTFDFKNGEAVEQAKRALMKVNSTNEMPMGGDLEIQFLDANGNVIYTIDERPVFSAAELGPDGRTIGAATGSTEVLLEDEDLRQMENAARLNVRARLSSTNAGQGLAVKFYDDYLLTINIALQADVELKGTGG